MALFVGKKDARELGNQIDKVANEIRQIVQSDIDRTCDKIDAELNSCGRELANSVKTLAQIKPLLDRLVQQVGVNAPDHVQVLVQSIAQEISSKVATSIDNQEEVRKNISDVDRYSDEIDQKTDLVSSLCDKLDALTDKVQN